MKSKRRLEIEKFVENQKEQLGLNDNEAQDLLDLSLAEADQDMEKEELSAVWDDQEAMPAQAAAVAPMAAQFKVQAPVAPKRAKSKRKEMSDPYLVQSQTIKARPTNVSQLRTLFYEHALPNEYIVQVGVKDVKPVLGGKFFKLGRKFLKFPAAVQTVYFTSDNANKNYQGLKIDGYACWRIDPEHPEIAARSLDFMDQDNPMGNTNRILRTICTEAIRHIIANITIEEALTKKDEIGRDLKAHFERIERTWGILFDQVGIERVTILSSTVFDDLQQKTRDNLRLGASESRLETDRAIENKKSDYENEMERLRLNTEKEARMLRATTESEIRKVELDEEVKRRTDELMVEENRKRAEAEMAERADEQAAERTKRQATRQLEVEIHKEEENSKLVLARAASEMEIKIQSAAEEARLTEALIQSEMAKLEAEHLKKMKDGELEAIRVFHEQEARHRLETARQEGELELAGARFKQSLEEDRNKAEFEHQTESLRLERLREEEKVNNRISLNRVRAELVDRLPEIAEALHIDRYTVFDGQGAPLPHLLGQVLTLLKEMDWKSPENDPDSNCEEKE